MNKAMLIGNLGQDPEVRYMPDGKAVTNVSIATSKRWKDKTSGEQKEATEWHRVVFFGKQAEIIGEHCFKGSKLYVEGELRTRTWDKEGVKQYSTEIVGREFEFVGDKPAEHKPSNQERSKPAQQPPEDFDDDIDF